MHSTRCYCLTFRLGVVKPSAHAFRPILHFLIFLNQTNLHEGLTYDCVCILLSIYGRENYAGKGGWNQLLGHFKSVQSEAGAVGRLVLDA